MTTTHKLKDGRVLKLVPLRRDSIKSATTSCEFCMAYRENEDPDLCGQLPPCTGLKSWMDDQAWARYVAEGLMK